jgi:hypothetical protein
MLLRNGLDRDKPLDLNWRTPETGFLDQLGLDTKMTGKGIAALESIVLDVVLEALGLDRAVSYSRRPEWYSRHKSLYGYRVVTNGITILEKAGLVQNQLAPVNSYGRRQSTIRATDELIDTALPLPVIQQLLHSPIELRDKNKLPIHFMGTAFTDRMKRNVCTINEMIASAKADISLSEAIRTGPVIKFPDFAANLSAISLRRIFNGDFEHGGRFYGGWWQNMPKAYRQNILIDGSETIEEDYDQLHPRLLYSLIGSKVVGDAYTLDGWDRNLCKKAFNILLNARTPAHAVSAVANNIGEQFGYRPDAGKYNATCRDMAEQVISELKLKHKMVCDYLHTGIGLKLQKTDSDIAEAVMLTLVRQGIHVLPVHDSFIVRKKHHQNLLEAMESEICKI